MMTNKTNEGRAEFSLYISDRDYSLTFIGDLPSVYTLELYELYVILLSYILHYIRTSEKQFVICSEFL